jgi:excisionase family DNA binding protein
MLVKGPCVSAAEAARMLGVSRARVTNMIASGILDAYREGRNTFVSIESIERRLAADVRPGRPAREAVLA